MDGVIKYLSATEHTFVIAVGRYFCALPFAALIWMRAGRPAVTGEMWRAHLLRGVVIASSSSLFFWAVAVVPLAEVITLSFVAPLIIPFFAALLLKEKLRFANVAASFIGFSGAVVAVAGGPAAAASGGGDAGLYALGIAAMLLFSVGYALSIVLLRARAERDGSAIFGVLGTLIPGALVAAPAVALGHVPALEMLPGFLAMGVLGTVSLWALSEAYARAEAQMLAPLEFTALPWAAALGYIFFSEVPRPQLWFGAVIIVAACLWSSWASARAGVKPVEGEIEPV
jgi:S-adenosylmethionine uptake transporter